MFKVMENQLLFRLKNKIQQKITTDEKEIYTFQNRLRSDKGNVAYKNNAKHIYVNETPAASFNDPVPSQLFGNLKKKLEDTIQPIPNHYQEEEERDISHFPSSVQNLINKRKLSQQNAVKLKPEDIHGTLEELPFLSVVLVEGEGEVNIKNEPHVNSEDMCVETRTMSSKKAGKRRRVKNAKGKKTKFSRKRRVSKSDTTDSEDMSDEYCPTVDEQNSVPHSSRSLRKTPRRSQDYKLKNSTVSDPIDQESNENDEHDSVSYENMSDTEEDIPKPNTSSISE